MGELKNLEDLFHHQLKDFYSAELQLMNALPAMADKTLNELTIESINPHAKDI